MRRVLGATAAITLLLTVLVFPVMAGRTEHCPDGWTQKFEGNYNSVVLPAGTLFCVKGSIEATGILVADGVTNLVDCLGNGHDVSYYAIYEGGQPSATPPITPQPTTTPSVTPSMTPAPSATPQVTSPPSPEPTASTSPEPTTTPTPSATPSPTSTPTPVPSTPIPTPPATDTE